MSTCKKDDWDKPRTQGNRLTAAEIAKIRVAFNTGRHPHDIARELECSSRTANKYYAMFRGYVPARVKAESKPVKYVLPPESKPKPKSRFYTSNFEL